MTKQSNELRELNSDQLDQVIGGAGYLFSHRPGALQQQEAIDLQKQFEVFNAVVKGFTLPDIF